ncbi:MAG: hypothetical protein ABIA47_03165 [bacterium]
MCHNYSDSLRHKAARLRAEASELAEALDLVQSFGARFSGLIRMASAERDVELKEEYFAQAEELDKTNKRAAEILIRNRIMDKNGRQVPGSDARVASKSRDMRDRADKLERRASELEREAKAEREREARGVVYVTLAGRRMRVA